MEWERLNLRHGVSQENPALCSAYTPEESLSPFPGILHHFLPGPPGDEELGGGCEDLMAVAQAGWSQPWLIILTTCPTN